MPEETCSTYQNLNFKAIDPIDNYLRVIHALMLRDMRTRFMGSYWGYVAQVLWPVTHCIIVAALMVFKHLPPGFGDSTLLFVATGAVPALTFQYISREIMKGILNNKPLVYYPQVKTIDVICSRIIVEIISSFLGIMLVFALIVAYGENPVPYDPIRATGGYLCAICFGISIGTINASIVKFFPGWMLGYVVVTVLLYVTSGIYMLPSDLPEQMYSIAKWNPLVQIVEWVRLGYDPSLPVDVDYIYIFLWVFLSLGLGLALERTVGRQSA